jgi:hypothetical protein
MELEIDPITIGCGFSFPLLDITDKTTGAVKNVIRNGDLLLFGVWNSCCFG